MKLTSTEVAFDPAVISADTLKELKVFVHNTDISKHNKKVIHKNTNAY